MPQARDLQKISLIAGEINKKICPWDESLLSQDCDLLYPGYIDEYCGCRLSQHVHENKHKSQSPKESSKSQEKNKNSSKGRIACASVNSANTQPSKNKKKGGKGESPKPHQGNQNQTTRQPSQNQFDRRQQQKTRRPLVNPLIMGTPRTSRRIGWLALPDGEKLFEKETKHEKTP